MDTPQTELEEARTWLACWWWGPPLIRALNEVNVEQWLAAVQELRMDVEAGRAWRGLPPVPAQAGRHCKGTIGGTASGPWPSQADDVACTAITLSDWISRDRGAILTIWPWPRQRAGTRPAQVHGEDNALAS